MARVERELDGYYFRIGDKNKCFSDLTEDEMVEVLKGKNLKFVTKLCIGLGKVIRQLGDAFDIIADKETEDKTE